MTDLRSLDQDRLMAFIHRVISDLGATIAAGSIVLGDRLGLYRELAAGPLCPHELASRTGTAPRYVEEWLRGQAAGGYVEYDAATGAYRLSPEQAFALTDPDGPIFAPGAFQFALGALKAEPRVAQAFRTGEGIGWHEHDSDVFDGHERFFRPGFGSELVATWVPALDGVEELLHQGIRVADVGCRHGAATTLMAEAYPASTFVGSDSFPSSIASARERAGRAGLGDRVSFEVASAQTFEGGPYELVTCFDVLHDFGDPLGAARHIREQLAADGTWMIVEPAAGSSVVDNLNPVGRVYYGFSTFLCVPNALSEEGGYSLGAQAGEEPIGRLASAAGFSRFRRVTQTRFHAVYEARP